MSTITIEELRKQYGGPGNRNSADTAGIMAAVEPYKNGEAGICITPTGRIIGENTSEMSQLESNDPHIRDKLDTIQDLQRDY